MSTAHPVIDRLRAFCCALPGASEQETWGHPTFLVANKIFATCSAEGEPVTISVKADPLAQQALVQTGRYRVAHYVGRFGWVQTVPNAPIDWDELEALILDSYRSVAPKRLLAQIDRQRDASG